jgi:hypothetical protein
VLRRTAHTDSRDALLAEVRDRVIARAYPRLFILIIVGLSGFAAFLFSAGTLMLGLNQMALRYFAGALVGYGTFLILLRVWISYRRRGWDVDLELPDIDGTLGSGSDGVSFFSGGRSGGAGASGQWEPASAGSKVSVDLDVDELWPLVLAFVCALGGLIAILYVVYAAPILLAEVALDAALVTGLYRRIRREDARYWLESAVRRTWLPALIAALFLMAAGAAVQMAIPTADSIGDVWRTLAER